MLTGVREAGGTLWFGSLTGGCVGSIAAAGQSTGDAP
jgi:hypothetical protein